MRLQKTFHIFIFILVIGFSLSFMESNSEETKSSVKENAQSSEAAEKGDKKLPIKKIGEGRYRLDSIVIDQIKREVGFPARINMTEGVLELLLCTEYGKTHESLFVTDVDPNYLNAALILIGLEGGSTVKYQGDPTTPEGSPVEIWIKCKNKRGKEALVRAEDWVFNNHKKRAMKHTHWIYVGSVFSNNLFMAKATGTLITTFHDPFTLIDNPLPEGADDTVYIVNKAAVPPKGTKVELIIKAVEAEKEK